MQAFPAHIVVCVCMCVRACVHVLRLDRVTMDLIVPICVVAPMELHVTKPPVGALARWGGMVSVVTGSGNLSLRM